MWVVSSNQTGGESAGIEARQGYLDGVQLSYGNTKSYRRAFRSKLLVKGNRGCPLVAHTRCSVSSEGERSDIGG